MLSVLLLLLACALTTHAQTIEARISVHSVAPARVRVEGKRSDSTRAWSFRHSYASHTRLDERLENLVFTDANGASVPARKLAPGEYETERAVANFSYTLKLDPPALPSDAPHISWLAPAGYGALMLGDLLPLPLARARLRFDLPVGWKSASTETQTANDAYETSDAENAIFFIAQNPRERRGRAGASEFAFVTTSQWAFTDEAAANAVEEILEQHSGITGSTPRGRALIILAPFPVNAGANAWSAETRGRTVFMLSGRQPSANAALAQLTVPLAHELFHLWIPNAIALDGEYDWFYEGFTLYQSLRVGMRLNYLSFQDYLNALGRAFDGYKAARGRDELSLLEASRQRWTGATALVYNKGMFVAALYDLTLRTQTSNKHSLDDVYRQLFRRRTAATGKRLDANETVIEALSGMPSMQNFTNQHVRGAFPLDAPTALAPFGLQIEPGGVRTRITVSDSLTRAQRDLLRGLGYNDRVRPSTRRL